MKAQVMKTAWIIRKNAAIEMGCRLSDVVFGVCLKMAWDEYKYKKGNEMKLPKIEAKSEKQRQFAEDRRAMTVAGIEAARNNPKALADHGYMGQLQPGDFTRACSPNKSFLIDVVDGGTRAEMVSILEEMDSMDDFFGLTEEENERFDALQEELDGLVVSSISGVIAKIDIASKTSAHFWIDNAQRVNTVGSLMDLYNACK